MLFYAKKYIRIFSLLCSFVGTHCLFAQAHSLEHNTILTGAYPAVDTGKIISMPAEVSNYNRRISGIVLHFTQLLEKDSLETLRRGGVSAHYLIPKSPKRGVAGWQLVNIHDRAWQAGVSTWQNRTNLNDTTIGIEVVNYGFGFKQADGHVLYYHEVRQKLRDQLLATLKQDASFFKLLTQYHLLDTFFRDMLRGIIPDGTRTVYLAHIPQAKRDYYREVADRIKQTLPNPFAEERTIRQIYELDRTGKIVWDRFTPHQIQTLGSLLRGLLEALSLKKGHETFYQINPTTIVGHSDIAAGRPLSSMRIDPGPYFPWKTLALDYGIGAWPQAEDIDAIQQQLTHEFAQIRLRCHDSKTLPIDITWLQESLKCYGYNVSTTGVLDPQTQAVLALFQMHFRPANYSGEPDLESVTILAALLKRYFPKDYTFPRLASVCKA